MSFYHYRQNNSGGRYAGPALNVIIEADNSEHADWIAESHGVYFDGVENQTDCPCCGDRWHRAWDKGDDVPMYYNRPIFKENGERAHNKEDDKYFTTYIHHAGKNAKPAFLIVYKSGMKKVLPK